MRSHPNTQQITLRSGAARWRAKVRVDRQTVYGPLRVSSAEAYEDAKRLRAADAGIARGLTLSQACEAVLAETRAKRAAGTVRWYEDHFAALKAALGADRLLVSITPQSLEQLVRDRVAVVSAATVNADLRALHRVFSVAIRRGDAIDNPVRKVDRPRSMVPAMDWFPEDELADVLQRVEDAWARDLFTVLFFTGLRRSEMARLGPGHVRRQQIVVDGKTGTRVLPLADDARESLRRLGLPVSLAAIDKAFRDHRHLSPKLHAHALRHSFATSLIRAGERPDIVQRLMGHRSLQTTMRYVHETGEEMAKAVGRLRLVRPPAPPQSASDQQA